MNINNITELDILQDYLLEIQAFIEQSYIPDDINNVIDRAGKLEGYMALSGKLLADAKWHYSNVFETGFVQIMKTTSKYQASTTNLYLKSLCKDYQYLVDWSDRINASCTHQLDFSRTLISKIKAEMQSRL
jgi:hypothetical protein